MKLILYGLTISTIVIFSCTREPKVLDCKNTTASKTSKIISLSEFASEKNVIPASEIITSPTVLKLSSSSENLVSKIVRIELYKNYIYILDENGTLHSFDTTGRLKYKIELNDTKNSGISDWRFNHANGTHYLWDEFGNQMLFYDSEGKFLRKKKILNIYSSNFSILNGSNLLFYNNYNSGNKWKSALYFYNLEDNAVYQTFLQRPDVANASYFSLNSSPVYSFNNEVYFFDMYNYDVYNITLTDSCPNLPYHFDFGKNAYPNDLMNPINDHKRLEILKTGDFAKSTVFYIDNNLIYLEYSYNKLMRKALVDRGTNKIKYFTSIKSDIAKTTETIINSLIFSNNKVVLVIYPGLVYDMVDYLKSKNEPVPEVLNEFLKENNIYDNPILIIGDFKDLNRN